MSVKAATDDRQKWSKARDIALVIVDTQPTVINASITMAMGHGDLEQWLEVWGYEYNESKKEWVKSS